MCGVFTQATKWGYWCERNPAIDVYVGKQRALREKRKLTDDQTRSLLAALPDDVRLIYDGAVLYVADFRGTRLTVETH
jgi:hypothetical protein